MRERWQRSTAPLSPTADAVAAMVGEAVPGARVAGFATLDGGLLNTNIRVDLEDGLCCSDSTSTIRPRPARRRRSRAASAALCRCRAPCIWASSRASASRCSNGSRARRCTACRATRRRAPRLGGATGAVLARIHGVHFAQSGFLDDKLEIARPFIADKAFLVDYLRGSLIAGGGARFVPRDLADAVMDYAEANGDLAWGGPHCLVHSDFNGTNMLARDGAIVAVLDWEFAFAGPPSVDFGNLLRNHPDEDFLGARRGSISRTEAATCGRLAQAGADHRFDRLGAAARAGRRSIRCWSRMRCRRCGRRLGREFNSQR